LRTKSVLLLALVLVTSLVTGPLAFAQPVPDGMDIPDLKSGKVDIVGGIADTTIDELTRQRIEQGLLEPKDGFEDILLTKDSTTIIEPNKYGATCLTPYPGGLITSPDPPRKPGEPPRPRTIQALAEGTMQLLVTTDPSGQGRCSEERGTLMKVYRFTITSLDVFKTLQEFKALTGGIEGLEVRVVNNRIVFDGKLVIPSELERLQKVLADYKILADKKERPPFLDLTELSPTTYQIVAEKMEEAIAGGPDRPRDITVKVINGRYFLEGSVDQRSQREEAERVCRAFLQNKLTLSAPNIARVDPRLPDCNSSIWIRQGQPKDPDAIIHVRVDFVTLSREYLKSFEFRWRPSVGAQGEVNYESDVGRFTAGFIATIGNLFPFLRTAAQHGYGRVLRTANLMIVDKQDGTPQNYSIEETVNIPVPTVTPEGLPDTKDARVTTNVTVAAQSVKGSDKINLTIAATQAQVTGTGANGAPKTIENKVTTALVVTNGESAALGGMIGEQRNVSFDRSPTGSEGGGDFEVFGIGRKQSFQDNKSQFIVFVTPTKMRSPEQGTDELKRKFRLRR
jgi:pilus assembly protein CpaC